MSGEKKSFLGKLSKISDLFYEDEDGNAGNDSVQETKKPAAVINIPKSGSGTKSNSADQSDVIDPKILKKLQDEVFKGTTAFLDFLADLQALQDIIPDEKQRYQAAFKTTRSGKSEILTAASAHLQLLNDQRQAFNSQSEQVVKEKVGAKKKRVAEIENEVKDLEAQIKAIQVRIAELNKESSEIQGAIKADTEQIEKTKTKFSAAASAIEAEIQNHISLLQKYVS